MDRNEYVAIHAWLRYKFGPAKKCQDHNCEGKSNRIEWALVKGKKYERKRENFIQLCKRCHAKYDGFDPKTLHKTRNKIAFEKIQGAKYIKIKQYSTDGSFIKEWKSATHAQNKLGILRTSIGNNIKGRAKTAGGFIWKMVG